MKLVVDANVVIPALIADSKTRELIVTLEPDLLTPQFVYDEIENYTESIVEKSGMNPERVAKFVDLLFQYIEVEKRAERLCVVGVSFDSEGRKAFRQPTNAHLTTVTGTCARWTTV